VPAELDAGGIGSGALSWLIWLVLLVAIGLVAFYLVRRYDVLSKVKMPKRGSKRGETAVSESAYPYDESLTQSTPSAQSDSQPIVTSAVPIAYLEILESVTRMSDYVELKASQVSLGRSSAQSDVAFENDITVSRIHATLHLEGSHFRIFDEHSTSGTWVNEQQVPEYGIQLMDGDEIHLGAVHLRYREA
jgi:pSer/pThr/pTyr-binding forkhead associated (FHA) protein